MASLRRKVRYKKTRSGLPPIVIQIFDIKKATFNCGFFYVWCAQVYLQKLLAKKLLPLALPGSSRVSSLDI